jgi:hypothetical protein
LWVGVKSSSSWEIAGSPRDIFRYSPREFLPRGRALIGKADRIG